MLDAENALELIEPWLDRLHVLVIGSGLGRDPNILLTVSELIIKCRFLEKPLVIDAVSKHKSSRHSSDLIGFSIFQDGLFLITQNVSLLNNYKRIILTPNAMEIHRLIGDCEDKLQAIADKVGPGLVVLEKAKNDRIYDTENMIRIDGPSGGSNRRWAVFFSATLFHSIGFSFAGVVVRETFLQELLLLSTTGL